MKTISTLTLAAVIGVAGTSASALDILWDQQGYGTGSGGTWNHYDATPATPNGNFINQWFAVGDVSVGGDGWNVDSVTTYHRGSPRNDNFSNVVTQAYLHVFPKSATLPTAGDAPLASPIVSVSSVLGVDGGVLRHAVTASGLDLDLTPGDYWLGLTPLFEGTANTAHLASSIVGDPSSIYVTSANTINQFAFIVPSAQDVWVTLEDGSAGTDYDIALTVQGTVIPEPTSLALLTLGGLLVARRRRA